MPAWEKYRKATDFNIDKFENLCTLRGSIVDINKKIKEDPECLYSDKEYFDPNGEKRKNLKESNLSSMLRQYITLEARLTMQLGLDTMVDIPETEDEMEGMLT